MLEGKGEIMMEYRKALPREETQLLDFIDLVFSQAHRPHDFAALLPKVYAHPGFSRYHVVAEEAGRILGTVALLPLSLRLEEGVTLKGGYIGSVSVHAKARGAGHMQRLMKMTLEEAQTQGMDFVALGGQRQRYGYYGFERGGERLEFTVTRANLRHAGIGPGKLRLREIVETSDAALPFLQALTASQPMTGERAADRFLDIMHSWNGVYYAIEADQNVMGGMYAINDQITEMVLTDEGLCGQAVAAWLAERERCTVRVPACNRVRANFLKAFAESYTLADSCMFRVLNWQRVLESCLAFKDTYQPLMDGDLVFELEGEGRFRVSVQAHAVRVTACEDAPQLVMTRQKAVEFFFSPSTALAISSPMLRSWLPLPLDVPAPDAF